MKNKKSNYPFYNVDKVNNLKEMLLRCERLYGDKTAFKFRCEDKSIKEISYKKLRSDVNALGTALVNRGMTDQKVAVLGENSYKWLLVYFAVIASNATLVPIDRELADDGFQNILTESKAEYIFVSPTYSKRVLALKDNIQTLKHVIVFDEQFDSLLEEGYKRFELGDLSYTDIEIDNDAVASIVFTSGTTGKSKGVMLSNKNITTNFVSALNTITIADSCLSTLPYHHTYESTIGVMTFLHCGKTVYINENMRMLLLNLKTYKPEFIIVVPLLIDTVYKRIWAQAEDKKKDKALKFLIRLSNILRKMGIDFRKTFFKSICEQLGGNLKCFVCGGAAPNQDVCKFFDDIGIQVLIGYGITECSPLVAANRNDFYDFKSCGVVVPCCEVRIDSPNELGEGEICVKGDNVMQGYFNNQKATDEAIVDGWFYTGDIGFVDNKGRLFITGRKKNIIVLKNGKNIYPEEIEGYFGDSRVISEIIVSGIRDENNHEVGIAASVFPNPDICKDMTEEQIYDLVKSEIENVNDKLPIYKRVTKITVRKTEFEKTTTKKIKRVQ